MSDSMSKLYAVINRYYSTKPFVEMVGIEIKKETPGQIQLVSPNQLYRSTLSKLHDKSLINRTPEEAVSAYVADRKATIQKARRKLDIAQEEIRLAQKLLPTDLKLEGAVE